MVAGADVVRYLLSAGGVILIFFIASVWITFSRRSRRPLHLTLAAAIALVIAGNIGVQLLLARLVVGRLEPFKAAGASGGAQAAIVILGSGSLDVEDWDGRNLALPDPAGAARVLEAVRVYNLVAPAFVISSGGNPRPSRRMTPGAETMRDLLVARGVPADRIVLETESATTRDEALLIAPILKSRNARPVILVTSGIHMRRALGAFRAVGVDAVPAIAQEIPLDRLSAADYAMPSGLGLDLASANAHEILGFAYYWLRGWWKP